MNFRQRAILAKIEGTYGTDAVPTGAADALLVADDLVVKPMDNEMVDRKLIQSYLGHQESLPVATRMMATFSVEMVSSGTLGTAPGWGKLLKACNFSETVVAVTSVTYAPVSTGASGLTMYCYLDGVLHKLLGCRGSVKLKMTPKQIPYMEFTFTGLYGGITDVAIPSLTLTAWKTPIAVNNANTSAFTLHSYSGKLYDLNIDVANTVTYRNLVGAEDVVLTDRAPAGSIEIEATTVAVKDFWTIAKAPTLNPISITHGTVGGFKVKIDAPLVQVINPEYADRDGFASLKMNLKLKPNAGNDELTILCI